MLGLPGESPLPPGAIAPSGPQFVSLDPVALAQQVAQVLSQIASGDAALFQAQQDAALQQASPLVMAMLGQSSAAPVDPLAAQVVPPMVPDGGAV